MPLLLKRESRSNTQYSIRMYESFKGARVGGGLLGKLKSFRPIKGFYCCVLFSSLPTT